MSEVIVGQPHESVARGCKVWCVVVELKRLRNSRMGNPTYAVTVRYGNGKLATFPTMPNAGWAYELGDYSLNLAHWITVDERWGKDRITSMERA